MNKLVPFDEEREAETIWKPDGEEGASILPNVPCWNVAAITVYWEDVPGGKAPYLRIEHKDGKTFRKTCI